MLTRILTASVLLAALAGIFLWAPDFVGSLFILLVAVLATLEWIRLFCSRLAVQLVLVLAWSALLALAWYGYHYKKIDAVYSVLLWGSVLYWLFLWGYFIGLKGAYIQRLKHTNWQKRVPAYIRWGFPLAVILPTGMVMSSLFLSRPWYLLSLCVLVWIADSAAYFLGKRFGHYRLAPNLSPKKTFEGLFGALVIVNLAAYVFSYVAPSVMLWRYDSFLGIVQSIVLGCLLVFIGTMGDLFESAVKRLRGVKDSGSILPGHGGILDRIDALCSIIPMFACILEFNRLFGIV